MSCEDKRAEEIDQLMADLLDVVELEENKTKPLLATIWRDRVRDHIATYLEYYQDVRRSFGRQGRQPWPLPPPKT